MTDLGLITFATDYTLQPVELARAVEERGIESLFLTERPDEQLTLLADIAKLAERLR